MNTRIRLSQGFSLIELLVTLAILSVVLGIIGQTVVRAQLAYQQQRDMMDAQQNARISLDSIARLIRSAGSNPRRIAMQAVQANPLAQATQNNIRIQSDWNPPDGDLLDPYENIVFSYNAASGMILKSEAIDVAGGVPFAERIGLLRFDYFDTNGLAILNPAAAPASIASIDVVIQTRVPRMPNREFRTSATVRGRE